MFVLLKHLVGERVELVMSLFSFKSFNYISCCMSKHTSQSHSQRKDNQTINLSSSTTIPEARENQFNLKKISISNNKSSPDTNFSIGILGGVLVSSLSFAEKLEMSSNLPDQETGLSPPSFILCSDQSVSQDLQSIAKTEVSCLADHSTIVERLKCKRVRLESSGVSCIAMPCHVSHSWYEEVSEGCSLPFLDMGQCVAKELKEENLRPLEGGISPRIGVIATNQKLTARHYQERLEHEGFEVILPDKATVEHTIVPAVEALGRQDFEGAQNLFRIALQVLLVRAVNKVILAVDQLDEFLPPNDPLWKKCVDPLDALARSCLEHARSSQKGV